MTLILYGRCVWKDSKVVKMKISHPCYKSGVIQRFGFSSHGCHFMWFTFLCQSPEVEDSAIEIQKPGSSCVCKIDIEPTIAWNRFSRFLKNKIILSYDSSVESVQIAWI